jgi:hypothetical protein
MMVVEVREICVVLKLFLCILNYSNITHTTLTTTTDYQNVGSVIATSGYYGDEPPLVTATPIITTTTTAASSLPTVAEAIHISKLATTTTNNNNYNSSSTTSSPLLITSGRFPTPLPTNCPHCHTTSSSNITTRIRTYPSFTTWIIVLVLFLIFWPICWIPLVIDKCKMTDHYCTVCNELVGNVKPLSDCCVRELG